MINEEIIEALKFIKCSYLGRNDTWEAKKLDKAIEALRQGSCDDAVSRQAILDCKYAISDDEIGERKYVVDVTDIVELPPVTLTRAEIESKTEQFAKWVAEEVIDEELWELNYGAFGEIACRKLEKLGIVRAKGGEWELIESQEGEE